MIKEPQLTYLLELFTELGNMSNDFILAGAQAMQFMGKGIRATKDFDFVLDVASLKNKEQSVVKILNKLNYHVDPKARNFQFEKEIPNSKEKMRIEFLAPYKDIKPGQIRINIQKGLHGRYCKGSEIAIKESIYETIKGALPNGQSAEITIKVIQSYTLLMLKLYAMDDRYQNIRSPKEAEHDRNEARIHTADIISIIHDNIMSQNWPQSFWTQFDKQEELKQETLKILSEYFKKLSSPGIQLYVEFLRMQGVNIDKEKESILTNQVLREIGVLLKIYSKVFCY